MQTAARPGGATAPQGCYKCGQTGHWSRDCTVPQSQWIPRQAPPGGWPARTPAGGAPGATPAAAAAADNEPLNPDDAGAGPGGAPQQTAAALRKEKRKRPKLTLELLQSSKGLPDVMVNFPDAFRRQFKGRGHEASDLRRLLEMYKRWQDRLFPHGAFDDFICALERLSGTAGVRSHMHDTRMRLLREVQDVADPPALQLDEAPAGEGGAVPGAAPGLAAAVAALGEDDDDLELELAHPEALDPAELDDELLGLLEEPAVAGPAGAAGAARAAGAAGVAAWEDDDEGLMELLEEEPAAPPAVAAAGAPMGQAPQGAGEDEDELMELLGEEEQAPAAADQQAAVEAEAAAAEEERQLLALAGAEAPASQSVLPGSTAAGVPCAPGGAAAAAAAQGGSEEQDELLALLEEGDAEGQEQGSGAAPALASEEPQPSLVQPSPEFGAFTAPDAGGSAWVPESEAQPEAAGTQAGGSEVAAVAEPSLVLGPGSEAACCVPESEPISDPTQEL